MMRTLNVDVARQRWTDAWSAWQNPGSARRTSDVALTILAEWAHVQRLGGAAPGDIENTISDLGVTAFAHADRTDWFQRHARFIEDVADAEDLESLALLRGVADALVSEHDTLSLALWTYVRHGEVSSNATAASRVARCQRALVLEFAAAYSCGGHPLVSAWNAFRPDLLEIDAGLQAISFIYRVLEREWAIDETQGRTVTSARILRLPDALPAAPLAAAQDEGAKVAPLDTHLITLAAADESVRVRIGLPHVVGDDASAWLEGGEQRSGVLGVGTFSTPLSKTPTGLDYANVTRALKQLAKARCQATLSTPDGETRLLIHEVE